MCWRSTLPGVLLATQTVSSTGIDATLERTLDLIGVYVFALSGGMLAVKHRFDVVGVVALSLATSLGGGIIRDVVLGDIPPTAFSNVWYLVVPLVAAATVFVASQLIERRFSTPVLVFDAAGLGLFCTTGAVKASALGASAVGAVLIGVITAAGGGVIRDVLANEHPQLFQSESRLYAIPAAVGATVIVLAWRNGFYSGGVAIAAAAGVIAVRLAALRWGWRAPMPRRST